MKKAYVEITNNCNLSCDFCIKNKRPNKFMTVDEFNIILDKLKGFTNYLYLHILGEPLLHPAINQFISLATNKGYNLNITTNGYLISRIKEVNIRQINISLHSYNKKYGTSLEEYMENIFEKIEELPKTFFSLRFWVKNIYTSEMIKIINNRYNTNIRIDDLHPNKSIKINEHVFVNSFRGFIWPDLENDYYSCRGTCYALKDHIGILVDGTVVPCCLDSMGIINLGNIFKEGLDEILKARRPQDMLNGFRNNKKVEKLCCKCNFLGD